MIRSFIYIVILCIIVFIPFSMPQKAQKKVFKKGSKSISIKIVEQKEPPKKKITPKVAKPKPKPKKIIKKKVIKKKVVKKKVIPKPIKKIVPIPLPEPKIEPVEVEKEILKEEPVVEEEIVQTQMSKAVSTSKVNEYYALIYEEISKNKYYPKKSRRFKQEDTIPVSFTIDKDGNVSAFKILKESKYRELNKAVKKMFKKMRKFKKPPSGVQTPLEMSIEINFKLQR